MWVDDGIAVVGMGCVFPEAPDLPTYWRNIVDGVDATSTVPASRWDPVFFDPDSTAVDRFYCNRGGFIDDLASFDPTKFGIMPVAVDGAEPDQLLALSTASAALDDAGDALNDVARDRVGVILGRGGYLTPGVARLDQRVRVAEQLVSSLGSLLPNLSAGELADIKRAFQDELGPTRPETAIGLVPNLAASRIANRLDLLGPAYTIDAACASSLIAIDNAARELESGRCDLVIAGGVHHCHDLTLWSVFCQLRALSSSGTIRPFSKDADGILIGEGTGMVVLERLADAERLGHRVYAVVRGTGVASDGRGATLMSPRVEGQVLALERAYEDANIDPLSVGLVEAHGTATPAGDQIELDTLRRVFGKSDERRPPAALGSVKSMIGHAMPAVGVAGFIKTVLAVHHGVLPPTLHATEPHPALADTRFELVHQVRPWDDYGRPRRAGLNAFGFGGINAHVVIENHPDSPASPAPDPRANTSVSRTIGPLAKSPARRNDPSERKGPPERTALTERVVLVQGEDGAELAQRLQKLDGELNRNGPALVSSTGAGPARLAIVDPTPKRVELATRIVAKGAPWRGRNDIWFSPEPFVANGGGVAFLFPGVESTFEPRVDDVAAHFGLPFPAAPDGAGPLEAQARAIFHLGRLLHAAMDELAIAPDHVAGHSLGEWTGLAITEVIPRDVVDTFVDSLEPGRVEVPGVVYLSLGCSADVAQDVIGSRSGVTVSHDNCPHQSVICGDPEIIAELTTEFRERKIMAQELPFRSGYHSPLFAPYLDSVRQHWDRMPMGPAAIPFWSATTVDRYPTDAEAIRALSSRHLVEPVRFRQLTERLYAEGVRVFIQVGVGSLAAFVDDTLRDQDHVAIVASAPKRSGLEQLTRVAAAAWAEGVDVRFDALGLIADPPAPAPFAADEVAAPAESTSGAAMSLTLGAPLVRLPASCTISSNAGTVATRVPRPVASATDRIVAAHQAVLDDLAATSNDVLAALEARRDATQVVPARPVQRTLRLSVPEQPWLADHCFYRQPTGWSELEDRFPVLPMTTMLEIMANAAKEAVPNRVVTALEQVKAHRWLQTAPAAELEVTATPNRSGDEVDVRLDSYSRATVKLADGWPAAPAPVPSTLKNERPAPVTARELYDQRWMFHGPSFQCVSEIGAIGDDGIRGVLEANAVPGALLDNAGQLFGYWLMATADVNLLALPLSIERVEFFGPLPSEGQLETTVHITALTDRTIKANLQLVHCGQVLVRITGWEDRRFDSDPALWTVLRHPERELLSTIEPDGFAIVDERWRDSASRELMMRRYLDGDERARYEAMNPRAQRFSLLGRIAAKDAVKHYLTQRGIDSTFPIEVRVDNDEAGGPVLRMDGVPIDDNLRVSIAHTEWVGVALVGEGVDVGVDIEPVEPRSDRFAAMTTTAAEQALGADDSPDTWLTRLWSAKEAAAKAARTGLQGRPKDLEVLAVERANDGDLVRMRIGTRWISTRVLTRTSGANDDARQYVVAWTENTKSTEQSTSMEQSKGAEHG